LPHSGLAYAGFVNVSENMAIQLSDTLKANKKYAVSCYVSLANNSDAAYDLIQFAFTNHRVAVYDTTTWQLTYICDSMVANAENQPGNIITDTTNWVLVQDTFIADGGEYYMTVGNFDTAHTQYQIVDTAHPSLNAYYYFDDFDVHCVDCNTAVTTIPNYPPISLSPNPSNGSFQLIGDFPPETKLKICNMLGQEVFMEDVDAGSRTVPINLQLAEGVYIYRVESESGVLKNGKLVIEK